jgi:hypothetical protein
MNEFWITLLAFVLWGSRDPVLVLNTLVLDDVTNLNRIAKTVGHSWTIFEKKEV